MMNFPCLWALIKKNVRLLVRARASSLVILLGPLLIVFLAGLAFDNTNVYRLKIGTFTPVENDLTDSFHEALLDNFQVFSFPSEDACVEGVKRDSVHTCIVFSENFTVGDLGHNSLTFYVDYSKINLVWSVMSVVSGSVGEEVMALSQNLTGALLDALDFTQKNVDEQRGVIVRLTTENDLVNRNAAELMAELSDIDLTFETGAVGLDAVRSGKGKVKHWVDAVLDIGSSALSEATSFIDAADDLVKSSDASSSTKSSLLASFQSAVDDIGKLQERFDTSKGLALQEFGEFDAALTELNDNLDRLKDRLGEADASRQLGVRVLQAVRTLLDKSLINLLEVQKSLNEVEDRISAIEIRDPAAVTQPIVTRIKPVSAKTSYLNYLFPSLVIIVIMFTALLVAPTLVMLEKKSPAAFRSYMTPTSAWNYFVALFSTAFILLIVQVIVVLAIAGAFFSSQILGGALGVAVVLVLSSAFFVFLGMLLGYSLDSEETAMIAGVSVSAILLFLSNVVVPIESMPALMASLAHANPFVVASDVFRQVLLFGASLADVGTSVLVLVLYVLLAGFAAAGVYAAQKRNMALSSIKLVLPKVRDLFRVRFK